MFKDYHDSYYNLRKLFNRDKENLNHRSKFENFVSETKNKLFDVAFCKCIMEITCTCGKKPSPCHCKIIMEFACEEKG